MVSSKANDPNTSSEPPAPNNPRSTSPKSNEPNSFAASSITGTTIYGGGDGVAEPKPGQQQAQLAESLKDFRFPEDKNTGNGGGNPDDPTHILITAPSNSTLQSTNNLKRNVTIENATGGAGRGPGTETLLKKGQTKTIKLNSAPSSNKSKNSKLKKLRLLPRRIVGRLRRLSSRIKTRAQKRKDKMKPSGALKLKMQLEEPMQKVGEVSEMAGVPKPPKPEA
ncbi:hypothetical protein B0H63DRAFT_463240 [Podospora didyma]|uniref:Uncharacterized protein n=1 Tax=Podospora didyma TaxID=330526 RepID=A0AAE0U343_9PEZI|nr:hypothetical protein B0H63DRAFT_463240 [Podospora didyma]